MSHHPVLDGMTGSWECVVCGAIVMVIHIQDYGMAASGAHGGGLIPLQDAHVLAQGASRLADGVTDAVAGSAALTGKIEQLKVLGERAEVRKGLERFHRETMTAFQSRNDYENFSRDWEDAVATKLPDYFPGNLSETTRVDLDEAIRQLRVTGGIEVREMAHLGMVERARSSWKAGMEVAARSGDSPALEKGLEEGTGVFIPVSAGESYKKELLQAGKDSGIERESLGNPLVALRELDDGRHPFSNRKDKAIDLEAKCTEQALVVKEHLGAFYANALSHGEPLDPQSVYNAEQRMFLKPEQVRSLLDGEAQKRREMMEGVRFKAPEADLCEWRRRIDERNVTREGEAEFLISLATAGLPRRDFVALHERFLKTASVPDGIRKHVSRELSAMYRNGLWGAPGDDVALKAWRRMQDEVMDAIVQEPSDTTREKADELIDRERMKQGASWVDFSSMQAKQDNKKTNI